MPPRHWKETLLRTQTATPTPTRRERRLAARAAATHATHRPRQGTTRSRTSPLIWTTIAVGLIGVVVVAALLVLQGTAPRSVDAGSLEAPMSEVPASLADGRSLGRPDAPVTLEIWSDFQCPACGQLAEMVEPTLIREYVTTGTLRLVLRDAAFQGQRTGATYDESVEAAAGARCAAAQDAYWPFHNWLFANQIGENQGAFHDERLRGIATASGLNVVAWDACRATGEQQTAVRAETQLALDQGVNATPTMYLNGEVIVGLKSAQELGTLIEAAALGS